MGVAVVPDLQRGLDALVLRGKRVEVLELAMSAAVVGIDEDHRDCGVNLAEPCDILLEERSDDELGPLRHRVVVKLDDILPVGVVIGDLGSRICPAVGLDA